MQAEAKERGELPLEDGGLEEETKAQLVPVQGTPSTSAALATEDSQPRTSDSKASSRQPGPQSRQDKRKSLKEREAKLN